MIHYLFSCFTKFVLRSTKGCPVEFLGFFACSHGLSSLTLDTQCTIDTDCPPSQACLGGQCKNPCSMRGVCGIKALCQVQNHQILCICPQCHIGNPQIDCQPDPNCSSIRTPPTPIHCKSNDECPDTQACNAKIGQCLNPCSSMNKCEKNKRCEVRNHSPVCICKFGFTVNSAGEFICAGRKIECREHQECLSTQACKDNQCVNPCATEQPCPPTKKCSVVNHQPVCICEEGCQPSVSICLNDKGCPSSQSCLNYQCSDPCISHVCPGASPCYVEDHRPLCKFCPSGFTVEENFGCVPGKSKRNLTLTCDSRYIYIYI